MHVTGVVADADENALDSGVCDPQGEWSSTHLTGLWVMGCPMQAYTKEGDFGHAHEWLDSKIVNSPTRQWTEEAWP